ASVRRRCSSPRARSRMSSQVRTAPRTAPSRRPSRSIDVPFMGSAHHGGATAERHHALAACPSDLLVLLDDLGGVDPPVALVPDQNEVVDRPVPPGVVGGQLGDAHRGPAVVDRRLADLEIEGDVGLFRDVLRPRLAGVVLTAEVLGGDLLEGLAVLGLPGLEVLCHDVLGRLAHGASPRWMRASPPGAAEPSPTPPPHSGPAPPRRPCAPPPPGAPPTPTPPPPPPPPAAAGSRRPPQAPAPKPAL